MRKSISLHITKKIHEKNYFVHRRAFAFGAAC